MTRTVQAKEVTLLELEANYGLQIVYDEQFFIANSDQPVFGLITNGASFLFIKLVKQQAPVYGFSRLFYLYNPGNELYNVLSILKRLGQ